MTRNVSRSVPLPPPVPTSSRPPLNPPKQMSQPPQLPPSRTNNEPNLRSPIQPGGNQILDINSIAVRDKRNQLRTAIPNQFRDNEINNNQQEEEEEVDLTNMSIKDRLALLNKKGGNMFSGATSNTPAKSARPMAERQPPKAAVTPNQVDRSRPLPPPPSVDPRQSTSSNNSQNSGTSVVLSFSICFQTKPSLSCLR